MEPPKVEDKNRQVNSTQSILFQSNLLWEYSPEIIYCQQLNQISNMIANEFDKQPLDSKESFLSSMVLNLQKKDYSSSFFTFLPQFDTLRMMMAGYYPVNFIESLKKS